MILQGQRVLLLQTHSSNMNQNFVNYPLFLYCIGAHIHVGGDLVEKIVPWLAKALEGDELINFCRATQVLTSFSQHGMRLCCTLGWIADVCQGRLGDLVSTSDRISPSVVISAIIRWLGRNAVKAFSIATTTLLTLAGPCQYHGIIFMLLTADCISDDANPDAIRDAIRSAIWDSSALQVLINKALKSPNEWLVYHAVIALQLFIDHGKNFRQHVPCLF
jgi:hypothetical protein